MLPQQGRNPLMHHVDFVCFATLMSPAVLLSSSTLTTAVANPTKMPNLVVDK
jgi:hypothetical protein